MALNRYRLRHLIRKRHRAAVRVGRLLERTDRLLGVILIGNTFANILAAASATIIAVHFWGEGGVFLATIVLTLLVLIFAEITPKTLAALYPERVAFFASWPLEVLLKLLYPVVWLANGASNGLLRIFRIKIKKRDMETLTYEELRTVVNETGGKAAFNYQKMLLGILDLEKITVNDVILPRSEINGIDMDEDVGSIKEKLLNVKHNYLPLYSESIDKVLGMLKIRNAARLLLQESFTKAELLKLTDPIYFIPEGTYLSQQLLNFKRKKQHMGLVVDEYGDIQGLVTLTDILEEIVGEFSDSPNAMVGRPELLSDGSYMVGGSMPLRDLNRVLGWQLPTDGPNTLAGLVIEYLEVIPSAGIACRVVGYPMEIVEVAENTIETIKVWPQLYRPPSEVK